MKVLHLNTYSLLKNKSFPHFIFHNHLLNLGHESLIISAKGDVVDDKVKILENSKKIPFFLSATVRKFLFQILKNNNTNYFYPEWNLDNINVADIIEQVPFKPDVIMTYWTKFAFNQKLIYDLSNYYNSPVLSVLVDMAPLTGGCHYSGNCSNYKRSCGNCHILKSSSPNDLSNSTWLNKKKYIDKTNLSLLLGSSELSIQAKSSGLTKQLKTYKMLLTVDETVFYSKGKTKARAFFNIPINKKVIFFGAANLKHPRKGMIYLIDALKKLSSIKKDSYRNNDIILLIAGKKLKNIDIPFDFINLGYLQNINDLARAFRACDVFACPSVEDSGPYMINQSIMSGRPVVAFQMGVSSDLIINGNTGYISKMRDSDEFSIGLHKILSLSESQWKDISQNCRELGLSRFSRNVNMNNLERILFKLINKRDKNF